MLPIPIKLLDPAAKVPTLARAGDAGYDLYACHPLIIPPLRWALIDTGVSMAIPFGYYGRIAGRSGLAYKRGISVLGGVIDSSFRGPIGCVLYNGDANAEFVVSGGDRVAQIIIERCFEAQFDLLLENEEMPPSERWDSGWGSTGA